MWLIRRVTSFLQDVLPYMFVLVLVAGAYGYMSNEDYNDAFSVTFTFSCKTVLSNTSDYPIMVVNDCIQLDKEMRSK